MSRPGLEKSFCPHLRVGCEWFWLGRCSWAQSGRWHSRDPVETPSEGAVLPSGRRRDSPAIIRHGPQQWVRWDSRLAVADATQEILAKERLKMVGRGPGRSSRDRGLVALAHGGEPWLGAQVAPNSLKYRFESGLRQYQLSVILRPDCPIDSWINSQDIAAQLLATSTQCNKATPFPGGVGRTRASKARMSTKLRRRRQDASRRSTLSNSRSIANGLRI
jgi:hypothetical protein